MTSKAERAFQAEGTANAKVLCEDELEKQRRSE